MPLTYPVFYLLFGAALFIGGGAIVHQIPPSAQPESAQKRESAENRAGEEKAGKEKAGEKTASASPSAQPGAGEAEPEREAQLPAADGSVRPSFDVVRIEQDGTGVIAGRAEPEWTVIVGTEKTEIARAVADRSGEWVVLLEEPLPPGEHAIGLHAVAPGANRGLTSEQQVAVSVAKPETSEETIVALSEPGRATRVMPSGSGEQERQAREQQQQAPPPQEEQQAEERPPQEDKKDPSPAGRDEDGAAPAESETADAEEKTAPAEDGMAAAEDGADPENGTAAAEEEGAEESEESSPGRETAALDTEAPGAAAGGGADGAASRKQPEAGADSREQDAAPAGDSAPEKVIAFTAVDYEHNGAETGKLYLSGEATAGSRVVLYLDNERLGEAVAGENGEWSFQETETLSPRGSHSLRADAVQPDGQVASRAEVAFSPPPLPEREVAAAPESAEAQTPRGERRGDQAQERERRVAAVSEEGGEETAGDRSAGDRSAAADGREEETAAPDAAASDPDTAARDGAGPARDDGGGEADRVGRSGRESPDDPAAAPAGQDGEEESLPFSQKRSIVVRRGDTLWHIARNRYGRGIRYTVIYQSNRDQIRDPDLIYPGQEFELPDR